jgi:transposase InsO family protein
MVTVSPTTWYKLIREYGWTRPRKRLYPPKPKIGIRASRPNEYWHIDTTLIKLIDGTRAHIQAVIDNFSRYILAWRVSTVQTGRGCYDLLVAALINAIKTEKNTSIPWVLCDGGRENYNLDVDWLHEKGWIDRILAQIEIDSSNSMIEAFFRSMKHNFLFLMSLCSIDVLIKYVDFYCRQHNEVIPHAAFKGATPQEVYLGEWNGIIERAIPVEMAAARANRIEYNRSLERCSICSN